MAEGLRSVQEVPSPYRCLFNAYPFFNRIQSRVMDDVFYSDKPVVVSAPTGSGKTAILELALVRLLSASRTDEHGPRARAVYVSPLKALCRERLCEWRAKLAALDVSCAEYTGDTDDDHDREALLGAQLLLTTPASLLLNCLTKIICLFKYSHTLGAVSPLKALCRERLCEWRAKLAALDVSCAEYTGDTDDDHDREALLGAQLLLTTPASLLLNCLTKIICLFKYSHTLGAG
ncbi:hypothetical protein MTO96_005142 [Rhipicephalus appendiculatus]